jgi:hypothetical protein
MVHLRSSHDEQRFSGAGPGLQAGDRTRAEVRVPVVDRQVVLEGRDAHDAATNGYARRSSGRTEIVAYVSAAIQ